MSRYSFVALAVALLSGCGPSHSLHVAVSSCTLDPSGSGSVLHAQIRNDAEKPIGRVDLRADLYRDFRFTRITASPSFSPVLDPGMSRAISEPVQVATGGRASISTCNATSVTYGDGTTDTMP